MRYTKSRKDKCLGQGLKLFNFIKTSHVSLKGEMEWENAQGASIFETFVKPPIFRRTLFMCDLQASFCFTFSQIYMYLLNLWLFDSRFDHVFFRICVSPKNEAL